jgi:hypothetical protein
MDKGVQRMKSFKEFLGEMTAGDSGGDATKIASGENSGDVVRGSPETLGKVKRKKSKGYAVAGLPEKGLPEPNK